MKPKTEIDILKQTILNLDDKLQTLQAERREVGEACTRAENTWKAWKHAHDEIVDENKILTEALNAIAKDNSCGLNHDAMAQDALKRAFGIDDAPKTHQKHCRASMWFVCSCVKTTSVTEEFL